MRARAGVGVVVIGLAGFMAGCGSNNNAPSPGPNPGGGTGQERFVISIPSSDGYGLSSFSPGSATVAVGRTVMWENRDTFVHTTTAEGGQWNGSINPNGTFTRTFTTAGTFNYRCTVHAGMTGSITVQ